MPFPRSKPMRCAHLRPRASILRRWMLHHPLLRARLGSFAEATVQDQSEQCVLSGGHRTTVLPQPVCSRRYAARPEEDLRGRHRSRLFETTSTLEEVLGDGRYSNWCAWKGTRLQYFNMRKHAADPSREKLSPGEPTLEKPRFPQAIFSFLFLSSRGPI